MKHELEQTDQIESSFEIIKLSCLTKYWIISIWTTSTNISSIKQIWIDQKQSNNALKLNLTLTHLLQLTPLHEFEQLCLIIEELSDVTLTKCIYAGIKMPILLNHDKSTEILRTKSTTAKGCENAGNGKDPLTLNLTT